MASFAQLYSSFDPDPDKRGKQFERFVKWFLTTDPEWSTQVAHVWLWEEYPGRWGRDCGVDLVFKHKNGQTWAVQAKCYSPLYEITKSDVDRFLSETNRREIDHRLLITTTTRIGANAKQVCDAQEKSVVRYHLNQLDNAAVDYPHHISQLTLGKRKPRPTPHPHQLEAIENVVSGFQNADRGQLIMACGTGKTLVSLWVKERLGASRTLVLVPSLGLLSQIMNDWMSSTSLPLEVICVCSDETAGKRDEDEAIGSVSDLAFPVTNSTSEISGFLKSDGNRVVFSTYQSSPLIEESQKDTAVPRFDLIVADEAHRCAGKVDGAFATVLDSTKLRSTKRLFQTATPRTYSSSLKKRADEVGVEVVGMDDEAVFGTRLHTLPFGAAIKRNLLTDYQVLIVGVDNKMVAQWIRNRRLVGTETGIETDARSLAAEIGLIKAIRDHDVQRIISFHNRVKRAEQFSQELRRVCDWLGDAHKPIRAIWSDHVSGNMPTIMRIQKLQRLRALGNSEVGLLSNARCLSEGVDVPALDCVAFIDARSSQIDIVQAVGRAIRLSEYKKIGIVVIPVFIEGEDDPERAIEASNFTPIWEVLDALKAHDNVLSDQLDQLRIELGSERRSKVGENDLSKIVFDLPTSVDAKFAESLRAHLVAKTTEPWMFWYGLLQSFVTEHGHCRVPQRHVSEDGYRLGQWLANLRQKPDGVSSERKAWLNKLGFEWDVLGGQWEKGFQYLQVFVNKHGHCRVPSGHLTTDGYRLGLWVKAQRKQDIMCAERKARLDALGFIWDVLSDQWEEGFQHLEAFVKEHGHCRVPQGYLTADGFRLGFWIRHQREQKTMSAERKARLDALDFNWDPFTARWEEGFQNLEAFVKEHGHCRVPQGYLTADGFRLGSWVSNLRHKQDSISSERKARLNKLGFEWDAFASQWEEGFQHLEAFVKEHGHCKISVTYKSADGYRLEKWVQHQRDQRDTMLAERKARLDALGFNWDPLASKWEKGFQHLEAFEKEHGHCRVPFRHLTADGYRLGLWVSIQRIRDSIPTERRARLDSLAFDWDLITSQWEENFEHLEAFAKEHGHCRVPRSRVTEEGYRLGQWVANLRQKPDSIPTERKARLDALGFNWDPLTFKWEEGFQHLEAYVKEHGHCRVPIGDLTADGYRLGLWVYRQRTKQDRLSQERKARLDGLGFNWDPFASLWEEGFQHLKAFVKEHGHCRVPQSHVTATGYRLGNWVGVNRTKQDIMCAERKARLDALGFIWDVLSDQWEEGFQHLEAFAKEHGHCRVPRSHATADGFRLGQWGRVQRRKPHDMPTERKSRLTALGFVWSAPKTTANELEKNHTFSSEA